MADWYTLNFFDDGEPEVFHIVAFDLVSGIHKLTEQNFVNDNIPYHEIASFMFVTSVHHSTILESIVQTRRIFSWSGMILNTVP